MNLRHRWWRRLTARLINPWGIALRPPGVGGDFWISNAGNASTSTFLGGAHGVPLSQDGLKLVHLDGPPVSYEDGLANVTGQVHNAASDFPGQALEFPVSGPASNLSGVATLLTWKLSRRRSVSTG
ncbi:MAG: hypothetical protein ABIZ81_15485 [Opitutaceae bacterium]